MYAAEKCIRYTALKSRGKIAKVSIDLTKLAVYTKVTNNTAGYTPRLSLERKDQIMKKQTTAPKEQREELISKIMLSYKQLPPERREVVLSMLREKVEEKQRKG